MHHRTRIALLPACALLLLGTAASPPARGEMVMVLTEITGAYAGISPPSGFRAPMFMLTQGSVLTPIPPLMSGMPVNDLLVNVVPFLEGPPKSTSVNLNPVPAPPPPPQFIIFMDPAMTMPFAIFDITNPG